MSRERNQDFFENLDQIFTKRIVAIGENHEDKVPKKFLAQNAAFLRGQGYNTVLFEHLSKAHNEELRKLKFPGQFETSISVLDIRDIIQRARHKFPGQAILDIDIQTEIQPITIPFTPFEKLLFNIFQSDFGHTYHENERLAIDEYEAILRNDQSDKINFLKVIKELLINGVNVVGIENSQTIYRSQAGSVRARHLNASIIHALGQFLTTTPADQKAIVFVGNTHLQRNSDYDIPGISCPIELFNLQQDDIQKYFRDRTIGYKKLFEDVFFNELIGNSIEQALSQPQYRSGESSPPPESTLWPVVSYDNAALIQENISSISFFQVGGGTFDREFIFINTTPNEPIAYNESRFFAERIVCFNQDRDLRFGEIGFANYVGREVDSGQTIILTYGNHRALQEGLVRSRAFEIEGSRASSEAVAAAARDDETSRASSEVAAMAEDEDLRVTSYDEDEYYMPLLEEAARTKGDEENSYTSVSLKGATTVPESFRTSKRHSPSTKEVEDEVLSDETSSTGDLEVKRPRLEASKKPLGSKPFRISSIRTLGRSSTNNSGVSPDS